MLFASDLQKPMWVETLWLPSHDNEHATKVLLDELLSYPPTDLFLLGDAVNMGCKAKRWTMVDTALVAARALGFKVHGILGNHEVMGRAAKGEAQFQERFPEHVRTGYTVVNDSIAVVLLNSNEGALGRQDFARQLAWYDSTMLVLDTVAAVRGIIVCCHHSPYTASKVVKPSAMAQAHFVPRYLRSAKGILFLSGHAHRFGHYVRDGRHFIGTGGGGGLHHPGRKDADMDGALDLDYDPLFQYVVVQRCGSTLQVVSRQAREDLSGFEDGRVFELFLKTARSSSR